jgi:hypothetical protein
MAGKLALKEALSRHEDILSIKKSEGIDEDTGMYVCMFVCMYVYVCVHLRLCVCVHVCLYACVCVDARGWGWRTARVCRCVLSTRCAHHGALRTEREGVGGVGGGVSA